VVQRTRPCEKFGDRGTDIAAVSKTVMTVAALLTVLNMGTVAINWSIEVRANAADMDRWKVQHDNDFRWAVEDIAEDSRQERDPKVLRTWRTIYSVLTAN
jgi:hypothetical protein